MRVSREINIFWQNIILFQCTGNWLKGRGFRKQLLFIKYIFWAFSKRQGVFFILISSGLSSFIFRVNKMSGRPGACIHCRRPDPFSRKIIAPRRQTVRFEQSPIRRYNTGTHTAAPTRCRRAPRGRRRAIMNAKSAAAHRAHGPGRRGGGEIYSVLSGKVSNLNIIDLNRS